MVEEPPKEEQKVDQAPDTRVAGRVPKKFKP
jgi:hypothetical protein